MCNKKYNTVLNLFMMLIVLVTLDGCEDNNKVRAVAKESKGIIIDVKNLPTDLALKWYELELKLIRREPGFTPPVAARTIGYTGIVLYESLVNGMPEYRSLSGALKIPGLPLNDEANYHWGLCANSALAATLKQFCGSLSVNDITEIEKLEAYFNQQFSSSSNDEQFHESVKYGRAVAEAIFNWSKSDGGQNGFQNSYAKYSAIPLPPGMWQPTAFTGGLLPYWGKNRYLLQSNREGCQPPPPPLYSDEKKSVLYKQAMEVYSVFLRLTDEQAEVAKFWADPPGSTFTPAGHSMQLLCQTIKDRQLLLDSAAIAFSKMGIALNDAFISCWETKYKYNFIRPITYIRKNIKKDWIPFLGTPTFPEYSSGHSVQSAAMAEVMSSLFGNDYSFTDYSNDTLGYVPRHFNSFRECAKEAALSRLYGGIHFPVSIQNGIMQGEKIGQNVNAINFRKKEMEDLSLGGELGKRK